MYALIMGVTLSLAGLLLLWFGWKGSTESSPMSGWAGLRTARTMSSEKNWVIGHRAGAPFLIAGGVIALACGVACFFLDDDGVTVASIISTLGIVVPVLLATQKAHAAIDAQQP